MPHTVGLDFDGTLHAYTSPFDEDVLDGPEPGALEFVQGLLRDGYAVVVYSTRANTSKGRGVITRWLTEHKFPARHMRVTSDKPAAVAYVDDRAVSYDRSRPREWDGVRSAVDWLATEGPHTSHR